jgi:hypothetical protein
MGSCAAAATGTLSEYSDTSETSPKLPSQDPRFSQTSQSVVKFGRRHPERILQILPVIECFCGEEEIVRSDSNE